MAKLQFDFKKLIPVAVAVVSAALATAAAAYISFVHQAEQFVRDVELSEFRPPEPQSTDIAIVAITEDTLKQFAYRSPVDPITFSISAIPLIRPKPRML